MSLKIKRVECLKSKIEGKYTEGKLYPVISFKKINNDKTNEIKLVTDDLKIHLIRTEVEIAVGNEFKSTSKSVSFRIAEIG